MSLQNYETEMNFCSRCSNCKFIPLNFIKSKEFVSSCPSISRYNFHGYSGSGRVIAANSIRTGRSDLTEELLDMIYKCQMCGACDINCHIIGPVVEPLEIIRELRMKCVEDGQLMPANMVMIDSLKKEDNTLGEPKADRGKWADGLNIKNLDEEKAEVFFHVGCRLSYDVELRPVIRNVVELLNKADVDFGVALSGESCCGGRAFDLGYRGEIDKYAEDLAGRVKASGAKTLITACSDCFGTFQHHFPMIGKKLEGIEIIHISSYIERLKKEGRLEIEKEIDMHVTYHDPCRLGRLGEPYEPWKGTYTFQMGGLIVPEPDKPQRIGTGGIYDAPRNLLKSIPGIELTEMERIREYSYCCGAGGGVKDAYPEFALWTAKERIEEAKSTGAEAIVTSCPWCERNLKDAVEKNGESIKVFDIMELVQQAI